MDGFGVRLPNERCTGRATRRLRMLRIRLLLNSPAAESRVLGSHPTPRAQ